MVRFEYDRNMLAKVERELRGTNANAKSVLKKAINKTARQARKDIAKEGQRTYTVKTGNFNKAMKIQNATNANLEATVNAKGKAMELKDFKVSPAQYKPGKRAEVVKAKVLKTSSMKRLEKGGIKAFVGKFVSGHVTVMQRQGKDRLPVKVLYSPSIPTMIGNEKRMYKKIRPTIKSNLKENVEKQIQKELLKGGK